MNQQFSRTYERVKEYFSGKRIEVLIVTLASIMALAATIYSHMNGYIVAYGDAESHLNIAKRVISSITPGFAQLGGIWLPLPHVLLIPFVWIDWLWRTGLAGAIVSGVAYVISAFYIYRLAFLLTRFKLSSLFASLVFIFNPNVLYLQTTPMTEVLLILFFILSSYYFIRYIEDDSDILNLLRAAFFGFCASLSRYDGWALVLVEAGILFLYYFPFKKVFARIRSSLSGAEKAAKTEEQAAFSKLEGRIIIFSTAAFFGIALWLIWGYLILGDPLYFTHSEFSANSQQQGWLARGELPAYQNIFTALAYYFVTSAQNIGALITILSLMGALFFAIGSQHKHKWLILLVLLVPFIFNVATLYLGQSVIFIPALTPDTFEYNLFNVRYGVMMVPFAALFAGYVFSKMHLFLKPALVALLVAQIASFATGREKVIAFEDGVRGLSSAIAKVPDAQQWINREYDHGMLITDDFARTISIIRTPIDMKDVIYVGNKPYWEESLQNPEKHVRWIVMQKNDMLWRELWEKPEKQAHLFKYFNKAYTSEEVLIFKRIDEGQVTQNQ